LHKEEKVVDGRRKMLNESFIICTIQQNVIRIIKWDEMGKTCSTHVNYAKSTQFFLGGGAEILKARDHLGDQDVNGNVVLE
jgi:hypothetical protein